mgnify:FL=1
MDLIILGAGGLGRCCLDIARKTYEDIVFLDDGLIGNTLNGCSVVGGIDEMEALFPKYQNIVIAISNNKLRMRLADMAKKIGYKLVNLISDKAIVSEYAVLGKEGCIVFPNVVIESNSSIGNSCIICANAVINHDAVIDDYCLINSSSVIRPTAKLSKYTHIGCNCLIGKELKDKLFISDGEVVV